MGTITHGLSVSGGGISIQAVVSRTNSGMIALDYSLSSAKAGVLTTRTDANTGTLTMTTGHGITTGQIVDIYWAGGVQRTVTVGTVSVDSVPFDLGIGDDLPIATTAVTVCVQKAMNLAIDGDNADIVAAVIETTDKSLRTAANVQFLDASAAVIAEVDFITNVPQVWDIEGGSANPFTGNPVTNLKATQATVSTSETWTLKIAGVQDASP